MTNEYIRKADAVEAIGEEYIPRTDFERGMVSQLSCDKEKIRKLPSADVVPVVHAYWIPQKENCEFKEAWMKCSACGYPVSRWTGDTKFCPNCGAKMDAQGEE